MIQVNPLVHTFHLDPDASRSNSYVVSDLIPTLPLLPRLKTTYRVEMTDRADGLDVEVEADLGVRTRDWWRVSPVGGEGGDEGKCLVEERAEVVAAPWALRWWIERQIASSHGILMRKLKETVDASVGGSAVAVA